MSQANIVELTGGLGQQMFQYAAGVALAQSLGGTLMLSKPDGIDYRPVLFTKGVPKIPLRAATIYRQREPAEPWTPERFRGTDVLYCIGEFRYLPAIQPVLPLLRTELLAALEPIRAQLVHKYSIRMRKRAAFAYISRKNYDQFFYESAMAKQKAMHWYIMSDDVEWCKKQPWLQGKQIVVEADLAALALMSLCEGGAVFVDDPLSWWGKVLCLGL